MLLSRKQEKRSPRINNLRWSLLLLPILFVNCSNVFQGPILGRIVTDNPSDVGDVVVFLRCSGWGGMEGPIPTDAEDSRVGEDGRFMFLGSITFPTTTSCSLYFRHPRYLTASIRLDDGLVRRLEPITLQSWDAYFAAGPDQEYYPRKYDPWPQSRVGGHLLETSFIWLHSFTEKEQHSMARYVPDIHAIYRKTLALSHHRIASLPRMISSIGRIEKITNYPYRFEVYNDLIKAGQTKQVQEFIAGGVLREISTAEQYSALYLAAAHGHLEIIDLLLENGESLNIDGCRAPLFGALYNRHWPAALKLIRVGADIHINCHNRRIVGDLLIQFARNKQYKLLSEFLDAGVPVDILNSHDTTALAEAAAGDHAQAVKFLLAAGADPNIHSAPEIDNRRKNTVLAKAVIQGHTQIVKLLLAAGANPNALTAEGQPLIDYAFEKGYTNIQQQLQLALIPKQEVETARLDSGETISIPWRRRSAQAAYHLHTSFNQVNDMVTDPILPGVLWLATDGGLQRLDPVSGAQKTWTRVDGLPSKHIKTLWFDSTGHYLWLATSAGLARIPMDKLDQVETIGDGEPGYSTNSRFLGHGPLNKVWYLMNDKLYRLDAENREARLFHLPHRVSDAITIPESSDFFISDSSGLWRFSPDSGKRISAIDAKVQANHKTQETAGLSHVRSLVWDADRKQLWMRRQHQGIYRLDVDTGTISRPLMSTEQISRCVTNPYHPDLAGQITFAVGKIFVRFARCFGYIDDQNHFHRLHNRIDAGPIVDAGGNIWFFADQEFYRLDTNGVTSRFTRPSTSLASPYVNTLHLAGNKLFIGIKNAPLAVLDLENRTWSSVTGVNNIQRLRTVAGRKEILALGLQHYYWVDIETLSAKELVIRQATAPPFAGTEWQNIRDLEYDGQFMWIIRNRHHRNLGKSSIGLYRLTVEGTKFKRYESAGGYRLGELTTVVQDPSNTNRLWLVRKRDGALIDFNKTNGYSELAGSNTRQRQESELLASALTGHWLRALTLPTHEALDPEMPDQTWGIDRNKLYLKRGLQGVIQQWPVNLPTGDIEVVRDAGKTIIWIATNEGLIEFPITESPVN